MKKIISLLLIVILSLNNYAIKRKTVLFGEHKNVIKTFENNTYRIFMDLNGDFYPENIISNNELRTKGKSQLKIWSKKYPNKFEVIAKDYNLKNTNYSEENYNILQDSIIQKICTFLNHREAEKQTWLIHGFRKKIKDKEDNSLSITDNEKGRIKIKDYQIKNNIKQNLFVELYWNGFYRKTSGNFITRIYKFIRAGVIFKYHAIPSATKAGYNLRRVFVKLKCKEVDFITHSTGSFVVGNLLFKQNNDNILPTPGQKVNVCLLASATPGIKFFKNYHIRNTNYDFKLKDNYKILNVYNLKDVILLKKRWGIKFTKILGNTSLGCNNKNSSFLLKDYFIENFPNSEYKHSNSSVDEWNHYFSTYIKNDDLYPFLYQ